MLDVKLRSSQVRASRARMAAVALGVVFGVVLGAFLLWRAGQWTLDCLVYENKAFKIDVIDIQTDGVLAGDELQRWSGAHSGENLLALDLAQVKRNLEMVSVIQSASVERILPHTLRIRVIEREPLAQINVPRPRAAGGIELATFQVDADGWVMLPLEPHQRAIPAPPQGEVLPVIGGINSVEVQTGRRIGSMQFQAALQLLLAFERSPLQGLVDLKRIDLSSPDVLVARTGEGSEVTFSLGNFELQLRRWQQIYEQGQKLSKAVATLDLAVSNNIPARWLEASLIPPSTPKAPKPLRTRKKHV